jgi:hypothetical protein
MNIENPNNRILHDNAQTGSVTTNLEITNDIGKYLHETGKWSKFLSILGFIGMGLLVLAGLVFSLVMSFIPMGSEEMPFPSFVFGLIYLITGAVYFVPILYLFRFSNGIQQAVSRKNQNQLVNAFLNLRKHYRFVGILMIIFLSVYMLILLAAIVAGILSGVGGVTGMVV